MFLRGGQARSVRRARGHGLLALSIVPFLVGLARQRLHAGKPGAVRVAEGAENVATYKKTANSERQYCKKCGGHVMTNHPQMGLVDVYAATLPN
jgi:putative hemolysin